MCKKIGVKKGLVRCIIHARHTYLFNRKDLKKKNLKEEPAVKHIENYPNKNNLPLTVVF